MDARRICGAESTGNLAVLRNAWSAKVVGPEDSICKSYLSEATNRRLLSMGQHIARIAFTLLEHSLLNSLSDMLAKSDVNPTCTTYITSISLTDPLIKQFASGLLAGRHLLVI